MPSLSRYSALQGAPWRGSRQQPRSVGRAFRTRSSRRPEPRLVVAAADASEDALTGVGEVDITTPGRSDVSSSPSSGNAVPYMPSTLTTTKSSSAKNSAPRPTASFLSVILNTSFDKEIAKLALPALLTTLLDPVMTAIDAAIVGRLGTPQLAAVGACTVLYNFSNFLFNFLMVRIETRPRPGRTPRLSPAIRARSPVHHDAEDRSRRLYEQHGRGI